MMAWPRREFAIAELAQFPAQSLLGDDDSAFLKEPLAQVDNAPAHDTMNGRDRAALYNLDQGGAILIREPRRLARRFAVNQSIGTKGIEFDHPIANDLPCHAADLRGLAARGTIVNSGKRKKPASLTSILALARRRTRQSRIKITAQLNRRHDEPPSFVMLNQIPIDLEIPDRVMPSEIWYYVCVTQVSGTERKRQRGYEYTNQLESQWSTYQRAPPPGMSSNYERYHDSRGMVLFPHRHRRETCRMAFPTDHSDIALQLEGYAPNWFIDIFEGADRRLYWNGRMITHGTRAETGIVVTNSGA